MNNTDARKRARELRDKFERLELPITLPRRVEADLEALHRAIARVAMAEDRIAATIGRLMQAQLRAKAQSDLAVARLRGALRREKIRSLQFMAQLAFGSRSEKNALSRRARTMLQTIRAAAIAEQITLTELGLTREQVKAITGLPDLVS